MNHVDVENNVKCGRRPRLKGSNSVKVVKEPDLFSQTLLSLTLTHTLYLSLRPLIAQCLTQVSAGEEASKKTGASTRFGSLYALMDANMS